MTMPRWLADRLVEDGVLSESGLSRTARIRAHPPCRIPTMAGIDSDGLDAWCELAPLSAAGEAGALLAGRRTHRLHADRLVRRDQWSIAGRPAGSDASEPVFAEHRCRQPIPAGWQAPLDTGAARESAAARRSDECPF